MENLDYFNVAAKIFFWLEKYQVQQKQIEARRNSYKLMFQLDHPIEGKIDVIEVFPKQETMVSHGIGLEILEHNCQKAILGVYDSGGIYDPIDNLIPGDHYATSHFALLGAILYMQKRDPFILEKVMRAFDFFVRTSKDEYRFGDWYYHWDFNNYSLLETFRLLKDHLPKSELKYWERGLRSTKQNTDNPLTNWIAMRAYASLLRNELFGLPSEKIKYLSRLRRLEKARHADGCYDDEVNQSRPIQYHVFTLALLHRMYMVQPSPKIRRRFLEGVEFFIKFIDPDGCYNYMGRGQEQIFGYGAGLYVLEAAKMLDEKNAAIYQYNRDLMWNYLLSYQNDGRFPLVLNHRKEEEKFGWYDYHHATVYTAFLGVWLGLAHLLHSPQVDRDKMTSDEVKTYFQYFKPTQNVIMSKPEYFLSVSAGTPEYLSEPGVTPNHIWFKNIGWVYTCPGGPTLQTFGKKTQVENVEMNFFAPIARRQNASWLLPTFHQGEILKSTAERLEMRFDYGAFIVNRFITFDEKELIFQDRFEFKTDEIYTEFRYCNFPIVTDKFNIEILGKKQIQLMVNTRKIIIDILSADFSSKKIEVLQSVKTPKGLARVIALRELNFATKPELEKNVVFSISRFVE
ncbi:MAG: hypothetical protein ACOY90_07465 [Candidatus Zhuqueibacterota bacterium]